MGEIKSTLDLVMERTRHLTLSEEERSRQQGEAFDKRLNGLLQQYADGVLTVDGIRDRMAALQEALKVHGQQTLAAGVVGRIDPDQENRIWMDLLFTMDRSACERVKKVLADYRIKRHERLQDGESRLRERLARDYGISGSAVISNPLKEPACRKDLDGLKQQALTDMRSIVHDAFSSGQT